MDPARWTWRLYLFTAIGLASINLFGPNGLIRWVLLEQERNRTSVIETDLASEAQRLEREIRSFRESRVEQERHIRDVLGWLKPGELSLEIPQAAPPGEAR